MKLEFKLNWLDQMWKKRFEMLTLQIWETSKFSEPQLNIHTVFQVIFRVSLFFLCIRDQNLQILFSLTGACISISCCCWIISSSPISRSPKEFLTHSSSTSVLLLISIAKTSLYAWNNRNKWNSSKDKSYSDKWPSLRECDHCRVVVHKLCHAAFSQS